MQQQSQAIYTFPQLRKACAAKGLWARLHIFDGGETLFIYDGATLLVQITAQYGDPFTVADRAAQWLMQYRWLTADDLRNAQIADASTNA